jgi:hypothetical protein
VKKNNIISEKLEYNYIKCESCGVELKVNTNVKSGLCSKCTIKKYYSAPKIIEKSDKPKGWRFMAEFVDKNGNVFFRGEEQPKLKGKRPLTDVENIRKTQKKNSIAKKKKKEKTEEKEEEKLIKEYKLKKKLKKENTL